MEMEEHDGFIGQSIVSKNNPKKLSLLRLNSYL